MARMYPSGEGRFSHKGAGFLKKRDRDSRSGARDIEDRFFTRARACGALIYTRCGHKRAHCSLVNEISRRRDQRARKDFV